MNTNRTSGCSVVFQALEKTRKKFPTLGKIAGIFSNPWKIGWTALLAFLVSCAVSMGAGDVVPSSGPRAGGNMVLVTNAVPNIGDGSDITNVLVGGVAAVVTGQGVNWVGLVMPAHAAGLVDIVVQSTSVGDTTLAGAYTVNPQGTIGVEGNPAQHMIAGGYYHSLGLKLDGTVVCWGSDGYGQCTVPEPNADFVSVGAGRYHSLGVKSDGTVACWGDNGYGQCTPPDPNTGFVAAEGGRYHSVAVRSDGTVAAWGRNNYGQCAIPDPNANFIAVSGGYYHNAGLKSDGSIVCWGESEDGQCDVPEPNTNFIAVAAGYYHSAGLKADGSVVCWGYNGDGQCTVPEPNANFIAIGAGLYHTMGLKSDGTIVCWGDNEDSQCDVPDPNANFAAVARGLYHTLGMKADGVVLCWGYNVEGQCDVPEPNSGFRLGGSSGMEPSSGSITGGYAVVITGSNLGDGTDVTNVTLCGVGVASITDQSATQMVVMASPGPMGRGDVRVFSTSFGETVKSNGFTYTVAALSVLGANGEAIVSGEAASVDKGTEFSVKYGLTNRVSLTLTNIGNGSLTISGVATSGAEASLFDVESYPSSLAGYGAGPLTVACRGEALGPCAATMTLTFDGTNSPYEVDYKVWGYQASSDSGPSAGGNLLTITYAASGSGDITNVLVDGAAAVIDGQADGWVRIVMPAHAVGAVSIVLQSATLNEVLNNAYTYNPAGWIGGPRVNAWAEVAGLPVDRGGVGGAQVGNELYVVGGRNNSGVFYSTNVYRFDGANWSAVAGLPVACSYVTCAAWDGELYAVGGLDGVVGYRTNVLKYSGGVWTEVAGLPQPSIQGGADVLDDRLYYFGGETNIYAYDGTNWTETAGLPVALNNVGMVAYNGFLYAVGGQTSLGGNFTTNVYRFDGMNWTEVAGLPAQRRGVNCVVTNGALLVIGGHDGSSGTTNVFRYDGTSWTTLPGGYPVGIYESSCFGFINDKVYGVAGCYLTNVYCFPVTDSGVSPTNGDSGGGFEVVIVGGNLGDGTDVTNVTLCGASVTSIDSQSATQVVVTAGAGSPGVGDVRVYSTSYGETLKPSVFQYDPGSNANISVTGPAFGHLLVGQAATNVFTVTNSGAVQLDVTDLTNSGIGAAYFDVQMPEFVEAGTASNFPVVFTPGAAGTFSPTCYTVNNSATPNYSFGLAGSACALSSAAGPYAGGNTITITNGNFGTITNVLVGGVAAGIQGSGTDWVTITIPATGSAGAKDIVVQTDGGDILLAGAYTVNPAGGIGSVSDNWSEWEAVAGLPQARTRHRVVAHQGALYSLTGYSTWPPSTNVFRYDGTAWSEVAGMPIGLSEFSAASYVGAIYALGGWNGSIHSNVYRYAGDEWTEVAGLPALAFQNVAGVWGGLLYSIGGGMGPSVHSYDGTNWSASVAMPGDGRGNAALGLRSDGLYLAGGNQYESNTSYTNTYRFDGSAWTEVAGLPRAMQMAAGAVLDDQFYVLGGWVQSVGAISDVYRYDGTNWATAPSLPRSAYGLDAAVLNGHLYAVGGDHDGQVLTNVYRYPAIVMGSGVEPSSGSWTGGYPVTISGTNLGNGSDITNVTLAGVSVASIPSQSATQIVVTAGAGTAGLGDVRVFSTSFGETVKSNAFTYIRTDATLTIQSPYGAGTPPVGVYTNPLGSVLTNVISSPDTQGTTQFVCAGWIMTGNDPVAGVGAQVVMTVTNDAVLTWLWTTNYWLGVTAGDHGAVQGGDDWVGLGVTTQIAAVADAYYHFTNWTGSVASSVNPLDVLMDGPKALTAHFAAIWTTNQPTPQWWMAEHGLTNFEADVLLDADGDGVPSGDEWVMNTDPTNGLSFLHAAQFAMAYGTNCWDVVSTNSEPPHAVTTQIVCDVVGHLMAWPCATDRVYDVEFDTTFPLGGWAPVEGLTNLGCADGWLSLTNALSPEALKMYRLKVRVP